MSFLESYFHLQRSSIIMKLKVILEEAEEGGYIVSYPALPGCHSQGDSIEDALGNIKEAIAGCIYSLAVKECTSSLDYRDHEIDNF